MIDAHVHVMGLGLEPLTLDLSDTRTLDEAHGTDRRLRRRQSRPPVDRRPRLEPGTLGPRPLPDRRRARCGRRRPPGLARAGRRPRRLGQQRRAARGRNHRRDRRPRAAGSSARPAANARRAACSSTRRWRWSTDGPAAAPEQRDRAFTRRRNCWSNGVTAVADMGTSIEDWMTIAAPATTGDCGCASWPTPRASTMRR